jgi:hypothetical protein
MSVMPTYAPGQHPNSLKNLAAAPRTGRKPSGLPRKRVTSLSLDPRLDDLLTELAQTHDLSKSALVEKIIKSWPPAKAVLSA